MMLGVLRLRGRDAALSCMHRIRSALVCMQALVGSLLADSCIVMSVKISFCVFQTTTYIYIDIEDACGGSSPHPQASGRKQPPVEFTTARNLGKVTPGMSFFMILGGLGAYGAHLGKKSVKRLWIWFGFESFWGPFSSRLEKAWTAKSSCFSKAVLEGTFANFGGQTLSKRAPY